MIPANIVISPLKCRLCKEKRETTGVGVPHIYSHASCLGKEIILCPPFRSKSCPPVLTILHEAAHNVGACNEIDRGKGPPKNAYNNAYSYENFAVELEKRARP